MHRSQGYALKGDAQLYGFDASQNPVALSATQHNATVTAGQDISSLFAGEGNFVEGMEYANFNADNPTGASNSSGVALKNLTPGDAATFDVAQQNVQTSNPAILVTNADIKENSVLMPRALSHKIFAYVGYTRRWESIQPYIGVGKLLK